MEEPSLYNGATLANSELLARLQQHNHKFVVPSMDEIAAAIDAARVPWERGNALRIDVAGDDDELAEPAPQRRQRKRSLVKVCEAARKAGADRIIVDGVVIVLSPAAAVSEATTNEWDAVLPGGDYGPN